MRKITHKFNINLPVQIIKEEDVFIAYTPSLELCTQGDTYEEAEKMFGEAVYIFFEELLEKGTIKQVLESCGWKKIGKKKEWTPPERTVISDKKEMFSIPCLV